MKKFIIVGLMVFVFIGSAYAGSSRILSVDSSGWPMLRFRIYAEGDSIASLVISRSTYNIKSGSFFYGVKTVPATPDSAYDITVTDSDGAPLCTASGRSTILAESFKCSDTTGKYEQVYSDITVDIGDLGAGSSIVEFDLVY